MVTGIVHVHSHFSSDGFYSIADLADFAREAGFRFVGLTDHAEDLTSDDVKCLRRECEQHSNESCTVIPGLEFRCSGGIHILGLGVADHIPSSNPVVVASEIRAKGGLAILAHPSRASQNGGSELYATLDGIEIWNAAYDGRFVPPLSNLRLLQEARNTNPAILAFGGTDLHWLHRPPSVVLELAESNGVSQDIVLEELRFGRFSIRGKYVCFGANARTNQLARFPLWVLRRLYEVSKAVRDVALGET